MPNLTLAELRALYSQADLFAKEAGEFREEALIPAHDQLRYAGFHILRALGDDGSIASQDQAQKAKGHCERAMYDAAEAGIMAARSFIGGFREQYKTIVVGTVVDGYTEILLREKQARDLISRGRHDRASVQDQVNEYMDMFRRLRDDVDRLQVSTDDLNVLVEDARKAASSRKIAILSAVIGAVTGALMIALNYLRLVLTAPPIP